MNSIIKIIVENFQSHEKTTIDIADPCSLTVLVGPSDSGKSAFLRAIRWALFNIPRGNDFIRAGATFARVTIEYSNGQQVIRELTPSKNQYKIITPGAEKPDVFEGFGLNVPLEIQEVTGVRLVTIGDDNININISEQLDGPFLGEKSVSGPARAKVLGKLSGTEDIDFASTTLGTDLYHRNQDVTKFTNEIAEKEAGIAKYDYLPEMAARIALLEEIVKKVKDDQERRDKLRNISNEIHEFSSKQNQCMVIINRWFNLEGNEKFVNGIAAQNDRMNILGHLQNEYEHAIYHGQQCALTINRWRDIDLSEKCIDLVLANQKKKADLVYIQFEYQTKYRQIQEANEILAKWTNLETAEPLLSGIMPAVQKRDGFIRKRSELANAEFTVSHYQKDLQRLASIGQAEELINAAENTKDRRSHMNELCYAYGQAHSSAENLRVNLEGREKQLTRFETDYQDTLMSLNICPTCGQEICKHKVV